MRENKFAGYRFILNNLGFSYALFGTYGNSRRGRKILIALKSHFAESETVRLFFLRKKAVKEMWGEELSAHNGFVIYFKEKSQFSEILQLFPLFKWEKLMLLKDNQYMSFDFAEAFTTIQDLRITLMLGILGQFFGKVQNVCNTPTLIMRNLIDGYSKSINK